MRIGVSLWLLAVVLAGCAAAPRPSVYEQMGGAAGVEAVVDDLLFRIVEDDRINHHFAETDILRLRGLLIEQVCQEAGGPCRYSGASMAESHAGRNILESEFNVLVEHLIEAMTAHGVPVPAQNRLLKRLAPMRADIIRG